MELRAFVPLLLLLSYSRFLALHVAAVSTIFSTPGSSVYPIPPNTHYLHVCCTGAAGAGASGSDLSSQYGAGGGGGGGMTLCERIAVLSAPNATVDIGTGGVPSLAKGGNGGNGAQTTLTIGSRILYAAGGGGGLGGFDFGGGGGGGAAGTSNANGQTGGSSTPSGTWNWFIAATGTFGSAQCADGPTSALTTQLFTFPGNGGGGCRIGGTSGGAGGNGQGNPHFGGVGGTTSGTISGGGGGGASAWAPGGNGAGASNQTAAPGSRGSGGGGGHGGLSSAWGVGAAGGDGYCIITPEE